MKVTVVADVPTPHQNVFFDAVARLGEVDLEVLFCRRRMEGRAFSGEGPALARHRFLRELPVRGLPTNPQLVPELLAAPGRLPILIGYYLPALLAAGLALGGLGRAWAFWTDTLPAKAAGEPLQRRLARRWFLQRSTASISTGATGRAALLAHGVAPERAFALPFVVDQEGIWRAVEEARPGRDQLRAELGIAPGQKALLFVGQMVRRKGLDVLLDALALAAREGEVPQLLLVGEGADRAEFQAQAERLGVAARVRFLPYVDHSRLARYWAAADALVLPSRWDPWPLVVVEALAAGLPVVGTDACGSVRDLVTSASGFRAAAADVLSLSEALRACALADLAGMRGAARAAVAGLAPMKVARDFTGIVEAVLRLHQDRA